MFEKKRVQWCEYVKNDLWSKGCVYESMGVCVCLCAHVPDFDCVCEYDLWWEWTLIRKGHSRIVISLKRVTSAQPNSIKTVE